MISTHCLAVLKASYDYSPQSEDEIPIKEDQILFLIERVDDDWWKVKSKDTDEGNEAGLVPAAYVEPLEHKSVVKALYDYEACAPGELSIKEDDVLYAFDREEDWLLVWADKDEGKAGLVPANYVEETSATDATAKEVEGVAAEEEDEEEQPRLTIIVPPSPPRPSAPYVDPAERVAMSHTSSSPYAFFDSIQTWPVSEVDPKGRKKKGTLGVGNGAIFFASESDKNPVQRWLTMHVDSSYSDKSKHVHIEITGDSPVHLHYVAASREAAEAIIDKLDLSKKAAASSTQQPSTQNGQADSATSHSPKPKKNGVTVHFATRPPSIISPREVYDESDISEYITAKLDDGNEWVTVLYDFNADGDDELTVQEGDRLIVLEKDSDEWWKVRDAEGREGVVPASYVELDVKPGRSSEEDDLDQGEARRAVERVEKEKLEEERKRLEAERKRLEAERRAMDEQKRKEAEERRRRDEEDRKRAARSQSASGSRPKSVDDFPSSNDSKARSSSDKPRRKPSPQHVRTWHDRTGQFKVDAEFLGFSNGKLRLHKMNGVVIEVPAEKMSSDDLKYIERTQKSGSKDREPEKRPSAQTRRPPSPSISDDDQPLAERRRSLHPEPKSELAPKKNKNVDWFEFFLSAGCDIDDCTRYASSFERDKIDESLLLDITQQTMRSLGLREGDIIRVTKAIAARYGSRTSTIEEQKKKDEELAQKLQEEENRNEQKKTVVAPAPSLFSGPGGILKNNTRRGRPQPSKSTPPLAVDLNSITTASEQIGSAPVSSSVVTPPRASSTAPVVSGFDDDAWTNRSSLTQPATAARTPSAPPTQSADLAAPAPAPMQSPPSAAPAAQNQTEPKLATGLARTTESDVFEQLARLSALRTQSPTVVSTPPPASAPPAVSSSLTPLPSYQNGLGMGSSPVPLGQLQTQLTQVNNPVPRGPFAPVPANQVLLQPLVPTNTGFNSFIPTRSSSIPPSFSATSPQTNFLASQPTGFPGVTALIAPQQTGFPVGSFSNTTAPSLSPYPSPINPQPQLQPTGFMHSSGPLVSQPTGFQPTASASPMLTQTSSFPGSLGSGPFTGGRAFGPLQTNITGYNAGGGGFTQVSAPPVPPVPPVPPLPTNATNLNNTGSSSNTLPANVFAQMKSGTFGNDTAPQSSGKYDALRPQPTGWGMQGPATGYQNGYSGPFY